MEILSEYYELMVNRENMYRFLGRLYKVEVDITLLHQLKNMVFPTETEEKEMDEGYQLLKDYLQNLGMDPITDLAVDYARVFLGAGVYEGIVANPYESVYTSPEHLIMQDARDEVLAAYWAKGLDKRDSLNVPEDHISLEFEYMAFMCQETYNALKDTDWRRISGSLMEQAEFLEQHLLNWIPNFCGDIIKCSATDFYIGVAKITNGFLRMEKNLLEELISETIVEAAHGSF